MSIADIDLKEEDAGIALPLHVERFRDASRARVETHPDSPRMAHMTEAFFGQYADGPLWERYARSMAHALRNEPVHLFDDELLVGMTYQLAPGHRGLSSEDEARWQSYSPHHQARVLQEERGIDPFVRVDGAPGHVGWRWDRVLAEGVEGLTARIRALLEKTNDPAAEPMFRGALLLWGSVLDWNDRHIAALKQRAHGAEGADRERLDGLTAICEHVPRHPARTFHEALQSFHMQHLAVMYENPFGGNGPGRFDMLMWPYLERDLERGVITMDRARELVGELFVRFEERLYPGDGWVEAVMAGGRNADGSSPVNPLSRVVVEIFMGLEQTHPAVYVRLGKEPPEDFLDLSVQYFLKGQNRAQIYNDDACLPAIEAGGVTPEDAAMYMAGGCMEISPQGAHSDMNFTCIHNVAKTVELVLNGGVDLATGERRVEGLPALPKYADFTNLYAAIEAELRREYGGMRDCLDIVSECYARYRPCYLLSSLMDDCLERGREQQDGGARYHDYGFSPLGITAAADSLTALKRAVYDEAFVSAGDLLAAMRANYEGYDALRARLAAIPRFGVEDSEADAMCNRLLQSVCTAATSQKTRFSGSLKPMLFNFVWTPGASAELGARADGSFAGDAIGHGLTPRSCAMTEGITSAMNSSVSLDTTCVTGGATTMWDLDADTIRFDLAKALLKSFLGGGGMIFQGNTTSVRDLEDALDRPEAHPNLIVRVGGFSARFNTLTRDVQKEIIKRRRHA